jgi:hypothetical protein
VVFSDKNTRVQQRSASFKKKSIDFKPNELLFTIASSMELAVKIYNINTENLGNFKPKDYFSMEILFIFHKLGHLYLESLAK